MVYYGKLSKGCERCRLLKVRCDQRKPGCKRCEKGRTTCPGYRDLGQVLFRDESARTIEKARRHVQVEGRDVLRCGRLQSQQIPRAQGPKAVLYSEMSLVRTLQWPLGQTAAAFFLDNFVVKGPILSDTNHDLLVGICRDHSESAASYAIEAVGLAGLSNVHRDHQLRVEARKRYGRALTKTNCSLSDPAEATSDLTAMAVLFLGQFESMVVESWDQYSRAHIDGALALLKIRGHQQCEREIGVRLFLAFRSQIVSASLPIFQQLEKFQSVLTDNYTD
ncbi:hypothetical protein SLS53_001632 [Cytospora paraplurivora]|uniref:Zn(2)-C6 fungal-type domain-containing protein n=1 Tax=Cytospora paraplurivora TaxID=2898453 RepID=A0AAN9YJG8_9PEZI